MVLRLFKHLPYSLWLTICIASAICIWLVLYPYQLNRACWIGEWPFEQGCSDGRPTGFLTTEPLKVFPDHLRTNPGNAFAYNWLALHQWKTKHPDSQKLLEIALKVTPLDAQILSLHVNDSLKKKRWRDAAESLIKLIKIGKFEANEPFLHLLSRVELHPFILDLITKESVWLDRLLRDSSPKLSIDSLLPVFRHGRDLGLVSAGTTINFIDRLQVNGRWLDAYSLWVNYQGNLKEGLFNAGFDFVVSQKAFDWKWFQSAEAEKGMVVRQITAHPNNGKILEIELIGRAAIQLPMVRQSVMLFGDSYVFKGSYLTDKLQINDGLSWKFSCAAGGEPWAQTEALQNTNNKWKSFELKLKVPAHCGSAVLLGLETKNRGEARAGLSGSVQFDDFSIRPENRF